MHVALVNPYIATVQTSKLPFYKVYFVPVRAKAVLEIIDKEKADEILVSMSQTALVVGIGLYLNDDIERHNVRVTGARSSTQRIARSWRPSWRRLARRSLRVSRRAADRLLCWCVLLSFLASSI